MSIQNLLHRCTELLAKTTSVSAVSKESLVRLGWLYPEALQRAGEGAEVLDIALAARPIAPGQIRRREPRVSAYRVRQVGKQLLAAADRAGSSGTFRFRGLPNSGVDAWFYASADPPKILVNFGPLSAVVLPTPDKISDKGFVLEKAVKLPRCEGLV
jgi:hypothetical protein